MLMITLFLPPLFGWRGVGLDWIGLSLTFAQLTRTLGLGSNPSGDCPPH